jgi:hypothetical protein
MYFLHTTKNLKTLFILPLIIKMKNLENQKNQENLKNLKNLEVEETPVFRKIDTTDKIKEKVAVAIAETLG